MQKKEKEKKNLKIVILIIGIFLISFFIFSNLFLSALGPAGPSLNSTSNETKNTTSAAFINISGGYIAALNLTATVQNTRWKAFVGWVDGAFTLQDMGGATIYNWALTTTTGRVYSTRDSGNIEWASVQCANSSSDLATESLALHHNETSSDNVTKTFSDTSHDPFWVAGKFITGGTCPTLNTYIGSNPQDDDFEEMALYDLTSIIYATILESNLAGYDGQAYDFQMLVPENGSQGFTGATPYYLYVELD